MQREAVLGHARLGIPVGSRYRALSLRVRGWFRPTPVLVRATPAVEKTREARSTSVEALMEGRRWNANT